MTFPNTEPELEVQKAVADETRTIPPEFFFSKSLGGQSAWKSVDSANADNSHTEDSHEFNFLDMEDMMDMEENELITQAFTPPNTDQDSSSEWFIQLQLEATRLKDVEDMVLSFEQVILYGIFDEVYREITESGYESKEDYLFHGAKIVKALLGREEQLVWITYINDEHPSLV